MAKNRVTTVFDAENGSLRSVASQGITEIQKFSREARKEAKLIDDTWGKATQSIGVSMQRMSVVGVAAFGAAYKVAVDFGKEMANFQSIALQTEENFQKTSRSILQFNAAVGTAQGPEKLAAGLYDVASAGFAASDSLKILEDAALGADGGATSTKIVADGLTTELKALGLQASDSRKTLDLMMQTVQRGKVTMEQYSSNVGTVAAMSRAAGVTQEEMHGAIALLTVRTGQAAQSFTNFRALTDKLAKPPKEARDAYEELGISFGAAAIQANGLVGQLKKMHEAAGGDAVKFGQLLGGSSEAALAAELILGADKTGADAMTEIQAAANASGTAMNAFAKQAESAKFQWDRMIATGQAVATIMADAVAPAIGWVVEKIQKILSAFVMLDSPMQKAIANGALLATGLTGVVGTAITLAPAFAAASMALRTWAANQIWVVAGGGKLITTMQALQVAGYTAFSVVGRAALAFVTGPFGIALGAAALFGTAWATNFLGFRDAASRAFADVARVAKSAIEPLMASASELRDVVVSAFSDMGKEIGAWVRENEDLIRGVMVAAIEALKLTVIALLEGFRLLVRVGDPLLRGLADFIDGDLVAATKHFQEAQSRMASDVPRSWDRLVGAVDGSIKNIDEAFADHNEGLIERTRKALGQVEQEHKSLATNAGQIMGGMTEAFQSEMSKMTGVAVVKFDAMATAGEASANRIAAAFGQATGAIQSAVGFIGKAPSKLGDLIQGYLPKAKGGTNTPGNLKQSNEVSCGQTSCAMAINDMAGKSLTDQDINARYGFRLLEALNAESGARWHDLGDLSASVFDTIEKKLNQGLPVIVGLNGPQFSPSGAGHIVTLRKMQGENVTYSDPADGLTKTATRSQMLNAGRHPDGNFVFAPSGGTGGGNLGTAVQPAAKIQDDFKDQIEQAKANKIRLEEFSLSQMEDTKSDVDSILSLVRDQRDYFKELSAIVADSRAGLMAQDALGLVAPNPQHIPLEYQSTADLLGGDQQGEQIKALMALDQSRLVAAQQAEEARYQAALQRHNLELELGLMSQEAYLAWLQSQQDMEALTYEGKLQRQIAYHNAVRTMEQETAAISQQIQQSLSQSFGNFLQATMTGSQSFSNAFQNLWKSMMQAVVQQLVQAIIKATILQKILGGIGGFFGGILGFGGGIGKVATNAIGGVGAATDTALDFAGVFHKGGIVGGSMGTHEVIAKLRKNEGVIDHQTMRRGLGGLGGGASINFHGATFNNGIDVDQASRGLAWRMRSMEVGA